MVSDNEKEWTETQHSPKFEDKRPEHIEIYWQDLTQAKQKEILQVFGENGNWDVFPIATIDVPAEDKPDL